MGSVKVKNGTPTAAPDVRVIDAAEWPHQRWGWLESVRRDGSLSPTARLVAHVLALDFAHHQTLRCDPSLPQIASVIDKSDDTTKRAIADLVAARWIYRQAGGGRGHAASYGFLTRAKIVQFRGGRNGAERGAKMPPKKGAKTPPFCGPEKGAKMPGKGGKNASAHYIAKPYKNHEGAGGEIPAPKCSTNPLVEADAKRRVQALRDGRLSAFEDAPAWVSGHAVAAGLLTADEMQRAGLCSETGPGGRTDDG